MKNRFNQNYASDYKVFATNIKMVMFVTLFIIFTGCSLKREKNFRTSKIALNEINFKDDSFKKLILNSMEDFRKKNNIKKSVLIFEISNRDSIPSIVLTNNFFLKTIVDEELDYSYEGVFISKENIIISKKNQFSHPNRFYEISNEKRNFIFKIGNNLDFCKEQYAFKNNIFFKINSYCTFEVYVD